MTQLCILLKHPIEKLIQTQSALNHSLAIKEAQGRLGNNNNSDDDSDDISNSNESTITFIGRPSSTLPTLTTHLHLNASMRKYNERKGVDLSVGDGDDIQYFGKMILGGKVYYSKYHLGMATLRFSRSVSICLVCINGR